MTNTRRSGLTRSEVVVAITLVVLVGGMLLPATRNVRNAAERMRCWDNLRQILLGVHSYEETHRQPASESANEFDWAAPVGFPTGCVGPRSRPEERLSWVVAMLPYLEQEPLYRTILPDAGYAGNSVMMDVPLQWLRCPSANRPWSPKNTAHYVALAGLGADAATFPARTPTNGWMGYDRMTTLGMISDGTSNTIAMVETASDLGPWAQGGPATLRGYVGPQTLFREIGQEPFVHSKGLVVGMADGSVRAISPDISADRLSAAITIAGDELLPLE